MPDDKGMWVSILMAGAAVAAVAAAVVVWQRMQKSMPLQTRNQSLGLLYEFQHAAATPLHVLRQIAEHMAIEMQAGLMTEGKSNLLMLPTYVEHLPDGTEEGLFYALDLGGTNFRVLRCLLGGKDARVLKQEYEEVPIPKSLMLGTSEELFDFIAKRLVDFVNREGEEYRPRNRRQQTVRELGLTFSFPVKQTSVKSGILIQWSKGFKIADGVGADVVALLQSAINRQHGPKIEVTVLVNDTVGTLAGGRYWNEEVMVGMILGTGTNACYVERDLPSHAPSRTGEMVINMEWGGFWSSHLPRTYADEQLDNESVNPGQAGYEKMIGGMYLGEIVRRVLLRMAREAALFGDLGVPLKLRDPFVLITPEMSRMHGDESGDLRVVAKILRDVFGIQKTDLPARRIVHDVCDIVTMRSARLVAAGIVGILKKIGGDTWDTIEQSGALKTINRHSRVASTKLLTGKIVVAMDGGLYEHYTQYRIYMQAAVNELLSEASAKRLVIQLSKDGSGIGATILAACHSSYRGPLERKGTAQPQKQPCRLTVPHTLISAGVQNKRIKEEKKKRRKARTYPNLHHKYNHDNDDQGRHFSLALATHKLHRVSSQALQQVSTLVHVVPVSVRIGGDGEDGSDGDGEDGNDCVGDDDDDDGVGDGERNQSTVDCFALLSLGRLRQSLKRCNFARRDAALLEQIELD